MRSLPSLSYVVALALVTGCAKPAMVPRVAPGAELASISVTSPAFSESGRIPIDNTCDGKDLFPGLVVSAPPEGAKSLVLIVDDPDASKAPFTHLVLFNLSPETRKLSAGAEISGGGEAARFGLNDFQVAHYSGPCPPKGEAHRYRFRVLALDTVLALPEGTPIRQLNEALDEHILGEGTLTGQFSH